MIIYAIEWSDGVEFVIPRESIPEVYKTKIEIENCMDELLEDMIEGYAADKWKGEKNV